MIIFTGRKVQYIRSLQCLVQIHENPIATCSKKGVFQDITNCFQSLSQQNNLLGGAIPDLKKAVSEELLDFFANFNKSSNPFLLVGFA